MVRSFLAKFSLNSEKRLLALCLNNSDNDQDVHDWNKNAVRYLVKELKKDIRLIDELERAISQQNPKSKCVLILKATDRRLLVSHRRGLPQVIYCRLWRWPDLQSHHQIKAITTCESSVKSTSGVERPTPSLKICVNPYHYERLNPIPIDPILVPCSKIPPDLSTSFEDSDTVKETKARPGIAITNIYGKTPYQQSSMDKQRDYNQDQPSEFNQNQPRPGPSYQYSPEQFYNQQYPQVEMVSRYQTDMSQQQSQPQQQQQQQPQSQSQQQSLQASSIPPPSQHQQAPQMISQAPLIAPPVIPQMHQQSQLHQSQQPQLHPPQISQLRQAQPQQHPQPQMHQQQQQSLQQPLQQQQSLHQHPMPGSEVARPFQFKQNKFNQNVGGRFPPYEPRFYQPQSYQQGEQHPAFFAPQQQQQTHQQMPQLNYAPMATYPQQPEQTYQSEMEVQVDQQPPPQVVQVIGNGQPQIIDIAEVPYREGSHWCSVSYHEYDQRIGEKYHAYSRVLSVDGYTQPMASDRFCIGVISNVNRNQFTEWVRRRIGGGVRFTYVDGEVFVECLSESSIFVSNPLQCEGPDGDHLIEHVSKLTLGCTAKVFSTQQFARILAEAVQRGFESVYKLTNRCVIRVSFVKGWGRNYKRQSIFNTPCWIEVQLNGPLQWIDKVLRQMKPPSGCGSTS